MHYYILVYIVAVLCHAHDSLNLQLRKQEGYIIYSSYDFFLDVTMPSNESVNYAIMIMDYYY
jgi:hypothetical protein